MQCIIFLKSLKQKPLKHSNLNQLSKSLPEPFPKVCPTLRTNHRRCIKKAWAPLKYETPLKNDKNGKFYVTYFITHTQKVLKGINDSKVQFKYGAYDYFTCTGAGIYRTRLLDNTANVNNNSKFWQYLF